MRYFLPDNMMDSDRRISVTLMGAGGTGGEVLNGLLRMHLGLIAHGGKGLDVTVYDPACFREANIGRQRCLPSEVGQYKALSLVNRINHAFGLDWKAYPYALDGEMFTENMTDLLIGCVDKASVRAEVATYLSDALNGNVSSCDSEPCLWLDFGNDRFAGQAVLGELIPSSNNDFRLPHVVDLFPALSSSSQFDEDDTPSCSLAEAIGPNGQDLFINATLALHGMNLLWQLFTRGHIDSHGVVLNVRSMALSPMPVCEESWSFYRDA